MLRTHHKKKVSLRDCVTRKLLANNIGDVYIQMLICTTIMLLVSVVIMTVASSLNAKMWLDEKLDDIAKNISVSGSIDTTTIHNLEEDITRRFGGTITYSLKHRDDEIDSETLSHERLFTDENRVQLNDQIIVYYYSDKYTAINIAEIKIETPISLSKMAISQVFYADYED